MAKTTKHLEVQARRIYRPESEVCRHCGQPLHDRGYYQWRKTVQQLDGPRYVASLATVCANPQCDHQGEPYTSAAAQMVTVPECTYGLDVIAQIGWWRDREHLNREPIHARLTAQGVQLCERQVDHLYAQYQVLSGCAERLERQQWEAIVQARGGLIIGLDGLEPEGVTEQLWVVREVQTARTLVAGWLPRVNHETLGALLKPVVDLGLAVLATVSDKQGCVRKALQVVWPAVPHQWCQSHYLGHAMRPIYAQDSALKTELRKTLRAEMSESIGAVLTDVDAAVFAPQLVTGLALLAAPAAELPEQAPTTTHVVRDLALDLQQAFARQGRAPFVQSGRLWANACCCGRTPICASGPTSWTPRCRCTKPPSRRSHTRALGSTASNASSTGPCRRPPSQALAATPWPAHWPITWAPWRPFPISARGCGSFGKTCAT